MENINDMCIIITGLIHENYIIDILTTYKNINNKIISTWYDQDQTLIKILKDNGFIILLNGYPTVKSSYNFQSTHIKAGLLKAIELGCKYVLRFRSDTYIRHFNYTDNNIKLINDNYYNIIDNNTNDTDRNDTDRNDTDTTTSDKLLIFINKTKHLYNKITFICGELCHNVNLHPNDLIFFGDINELLIMFNNNDIDPYTYPEKMFLEQYFKKNVDSISEYKSKLNSCIMVCVNNNIDFIWKRCTNNLFIINDHLINTQIRRNNFIIF
jgi:hypothetical protein